MASDNPVRAARDMEQAFGSHPEASAPKRAATPPRLIGVVGLSGVVPPLPALEGNPAATSSSDIAHWTPAGGVPTG
eukprot:2377619-Alexandrium_andersonii.AAC.1